MLADNSQALLDDLLSQPLETAAEPPRGVVAKLNYSHDAMINLIIADPGISQNAIAARFGYSASWVSQVMASDAFQAKLAERSAELVDPQIRQSVELNFKAMVLRSQEILMEKLKAPPEMIPDQLALRALELSSRAAGYGAREQVVHQAPISMHVHLEEMSENLTVLLRRKKGEILEGESTNVKAAEG
jgi:hypothetical protein